LSSTSFFRGLNSNPDFVRDCRQRLSAGRGQHLGSTSSVSKGESLIDTAQNLQSDGAARDRYLSPVARRSSSGFRKLVSARRSSMEAAEWRAAKHSDSSSAGCITIRHNKPPHKRAFK